MATANEIYGAILERLVEERLPIYYGELGAKFYNDPRIGLPFRYPLGEIHRLIGDYNRRHGLRGDKKVPFLNELVVNRQTNAPGEGAPGHPMRWQELWNRCRDFGLDELYRVGGELGFTVRHQALHSAHPSAGADNNNELGPQEEHFRQESWVVPSHHPAAKAVCKYLKDKQFEFLRPKSCRPDFLVRKEEEGVLAVVEVKPDHSLQAVATGLGQLKIYATMEGANKMILVIPNGETRFSKILNDNSVEVLFFRYNKTRKSAQIIDNAGLT